MKYLIYSSGHGGGHCTPRAREWGKMRIPLARYGFSELLIGTVAAAALAAVSLYVSFWPGVVIIGLLWLCLLAFFRDPERACQKDPDVLLSPADGTVMDVEEMEAPTFIEGKVVRVGIFMSVLNTHVNRSPARGRVRYVEHFEGAFHDARNPLSATENEHTLVGMDMDDGPSLLVNLIAGAVARRVVCTLEHGDHPEQGERIGMVKFGSRAELFIPVEAGFEVEVEVGDPVKAGLDVLARRESGSEA